MQSREPRDDGEEPFGGLHKQTHKERDERLERETERLFERLEEEENKQKKARASESSGESKASASSSGPATPEREVPRSRGGVPMSADSGDSVPETAKRNIGDSGQGESEESKEKKNKTGKEEEKGIKISVDDWDEYA